MKALHALVPLLCVLLGARAVGQLDLPGKRKPVPSQPGDALKPPEAPKGDVAPRDSATPLDLPAKNAAETKPPEAAPPSPATALEEAVALFRALETSKDPRLPETTLTRLLVLGPAVLPVARTELLGERGSLVLVAGRVCLRTGGSADRAAVAERLTRSVPPDAGVALLEELLQRDPVICGPEYLASLLEHPAAALRTGAFRALQARLANVPLQILAPRLESTRTPARSAALELVGASSDPLSWNLLASRLGDPSAQLARRAAELLSSIDGAESLLLERAFPPSDRLSPLEWSRARAYAVLALVEREESLGKPLLEGAHPGARVDALLSGLASIQPLVSGACAVALARIGFRASASQVGPWLERDVPHRLVACGTGAEFHADFSSLERPALRALTLLSGESFGGDGEAWRAWWVDHADGFHARHARIALGADAAQHLLVSFRDAQGREWWLCASGQTAPAGAKPLLRLTDESAQRLLAQLEQAGVFGAERLPGTRAQGEWVLTVTIGGEQKGWGKSADEPWLAGIRSGLEDTVEDNRWQLYFDPHTTSAEGWWESEHARWASLEPSGRRRELCTLVLGVTRRAPPGERDELVEELVRLYGDAGVPAAADFEPLLGLLANEPSWVPRVGQLLELARVAAGAAGDEAPEAAPRERLIALGLDHYGPEADVVLVRVARDLDAQALLQLSSDVRPRARALAAPGLVRAGVGEATLVRLRALLADPDPSVPLATLQALSASPDTSSVAELAPELLVLARSGTSTARIQALAVLAHAGGKEVQDLALEAVGDPDENVQRAGVAALAELADPRSASLLASLFARGPSSPHYVEARRGLRRLGPAGREECLRLVRSASTRVRREAALFLAETLAPEAAGALLTILAEDPRDGRVLWELGVLAGQEFTPPEGEQGGAAKAVADWWDLVVHDDPVAWLCAAAERAGITAPARAVLTDPNSAEGAHFLLRLLDLSSPALFERAARELEVRLGREFQRPPKFEERAAFVDTLREAVHTRFGE